MKVESVPIERVVPYARNPRRNEAAVAKVAASLKEFGWRQPIVVDAEFVVIAGHTRLAAARSLGMPTVPVHVAEGLTAAQVKAYRLADNRVAEEAEWDSDLLALELGELSGDGFDLALTGFDDDELTALLNPPSALLVGADPDEVPNPPAEPITKPGDLIVLGRHRLLCGDSTDALVQEEVFHGRRPALVFTDPPYGIAYKAMRGGRSIDNDESPDAAEAVLRDALALVHDAPAHFVCCDWRSLPTIVTAMEQAAILPKACIVWDKMRGVQNLDRFHKQHEFIVYAGPYGGERTVSGDVWQFQRDFEPDHPTPKPVPLVQRAIESATTTGALVADLFGGSGSTLIAAEACGRAAALIELSPAYCDVICTRWENATGQKVTRPTS